ncbi:MAG: acyl-CoA synthetase, partial [Verrucomicrobia bacterium]|nr:acyl-CoA synthetase [Verrucomicrobiota bacterium]
VAFLTPADISYVATQWGIWRAGGIAVPLCVLHPAAELAHVIDDAEASIVVAHPRYEERLKPLAEERGLRFFTTVDLLAAKAGRLPEVQPERRAMLVYTSGTTSKPKGAITTHEIIAAQIRSLVEAWEWSQEDHILNVLPLHHVHGIVNILSCALWSGAACQFLPKFDADEVWKVISESETLSLFMAVPTVYAKLTASWEEAEESEREKRTAGCRNLRLMVSGSAALPVPVLEKWKEISGHVLLERYGMTEMCMALSNPLHGERKPGYVGKPLPGVKVRLVDGEGNPVPTGEPGEIQVKGPNVFEGYWRKPDVTEKSFTEDGWFKTGDVAVVENGNYRIQGRQSIDIIKTGGYKVSALEIEDVLRTHEAIAECAVVGVEDPEWGQRVSAAVILRKGHELDLDALRVWGKEQLAAYKVPTQLLIVDELPRNPLGKVVKPNVVKMFEGKA